jgi:hypothetical protein
MVKEINVVGVDAMKDNFSEQKLKNIQKAHKILMDDLSSLCSQDEFPLIELMKIHSKLLGTIEQLNFWGERDNPQRFYEELKSHVAWIIKNYSDDEKKFE